MKQIKPTLEAHAPGHGGPAAEVVAPSAPSSPPTVDSSILSDVQVSLQAKLGTASLSVQELLALKSGSVVKLDMKLNDLVELKLNDALVARGEIVAVGDQFGVRIVEIGKAP